MTFEEILYWLRQHNTEKLQTLWDQSDALRRQYVGDAVFLRGLIEISNICRRNCLYCGIRASNSGLKRYRLEIDEILNTARLAKKLGYGTVVLQAGEDPRVQADVIANVVRRICVETDLTITLSLGERSDEDYRRWFEAGADRYLLRLETSHQALFRAIHPPLGNQPMQDRLEILQRLREIGYEIGSGVMVGIPGQSWDDLARDIALFGELDLDMIGCGPFLPHPATPLGRMFDIDSRTGLYRPGPLTQEQKEFFNEEGIPILAPDEQACCIGLVSGDKNDDAAFFSGLAATPFKVIALARCVCPSANIPSTTAIATIDPKRGRLKGLSCGANIVMPNLTPTIYRTLYEIYPNKAAGFESPLQTHETALRQITESGRSLGVGPGTSPHFHDLVADD